jgi:FXSXX-COOH protein
MPDPTTAGLIDLTKLPLADLLKLTPNPVLDHSIRRVTEPAQDPQKSVSAFNSAI